MKSRTPLVGRHRLAYRQLWRILDGAVADALKSHPEYLTSAGKRAARRSIVKRATGAVLGFATAYQPPRGVDPG